MSELGQKIIEILEKHEHPDYGAIRPPSLYKNIAKEIAGLMECKGTILQPEPIDTDVGNTDNLPKAANKRIGSDFNEFYIEALEESFKDLREDNRILRAKLDSIECGECGKSMLECECDDWQEQMIEDYGLDNK